jgi:hypothetical protein
MAVDQSIQYEGELPKEKLKLIEQLDEKDKQFIFHIIDGMLVVLMLATFAFNARVQFRVAVKGGGNLSDIPMTLDGVDTR